MDFVTTDVSMTSLTFPRLQCRFFVRKSGFCRAKDVGSLPKAADVLAKEDSGVRIPFLRVQPRILEPWCGFYKEIIVSVCDASAATDAEWKFQAAPRRTRRCRHTLAARVRWRRGGSPGDLHGLLWCGRSVLISRYEGPPWDRGGWPSSQECSRRQLKLRQAVR